MQPSGTEGTPTGAQVVSAEDLDLGPLGRVAFAYLASAPGRPVPRDELAEVLWGDRLPGSWDASLRGLASRLRRAMAAAGLGAGALTTAAGCYRLRLPDGAVVDADAAAAAIEAAASALAAGDAPTAAQAAGAAVELAGRPFLAGAEGAWVERRRAEVRHLHVRALEMLAEAASAAGDHAAAVRAAEQAVALEPFHEPAHLRLMSAHDRAGSRGEALQAYERCRRLLADELGVRPSPATEAAYVALLGREPEGPGPDAPPAPPTNLPRRLATFVGRGRDLAEVTRLLSSGRLVTLTGPGGVGKTRLALEVAEGAVAGHPGGTFLVELGGLGDGALVAAQVLAALGVAEQPGADPVRSVVSAIGDGEVLLVLDNCEHVVAAAAGLADSMLRSCPGLRVLATSREPLRVTGEAVWAVAPLDIPPPGVPDAAAVLAAESVRLFADRARAVDPRFDPAVDVDAVARVCRRLDGLPLALELAAARAGALSPAEIADRLDDRFGLLTVGARTAPPRQWTLRAAVDWSYAGLAEPERRLFDRLSIFSGGFSLDAAERVCAGDGIELVEVLELVWALVSKSLVMAERRGGRTRYRLLETLREYGRDALEASGRARVTRGRHLAWSLAVAEEADRHLGGAAQAEWLERLEAEHANLRSALEEALATADVAAVRLAGAMGRFWELRGHLSEGRRWLGRALGEAPGPPAPGAERARALNAAAVLAQRQGDYAAAGPLYEAALALHRRAGDPLGTASALLGSGNVAAVGGDLALARQRYEECRAIGAAAASPAVAAAALTNLGWLEASAGDPAAARRSYEEALAAQQAVGDAAAVALTLANLGRLALARGERGEARSHHERSLELRRRIGDRTGIADSLASLGDLAFQEGDRRRARALHEEGLALRRELGDGAGLPASLRSLADAVAAEGDHATARSLLEESRAVAGESGDRHCAVLAELALARLAGLAGDHEEAGRLAREAITGPDAPHVAEWLEGLAASAVAGGRPGEAACLLGAAGALRSGTGAPGPAAPPHVAAARAALGDDRFRAEWERGQAMGVEEAVLFASSCGA